MGIGPVPARQEWGPENADSDSTSHVSFSDSGSVEEEEKMGHYSVRPAT
jgi:hypothetical protein